MGSPASHNSIMMKPAIRIIHCLARSGATLICKCLGCMSDIVLLSEIHTDNFSRFPDPFHPLTQALDWHNIIVHEDIKDKRMNIIDAIKLIEKKCAGKDKKLIIRDLTQLDFIGFHIVKLPAFRFLLAEILSYDFEVIQFALVRHPVDQWLSIEKSLPALVQVPLDFYLNGYLEYSKKIQRFGFIRYEDFTKAPEKQMQILCDNLQVQFDKNFLLQWFAFDKITGDIESRAKGLHKIVSLPRRPVDENTLRQFRANKKYWEALELLNYSDEE